MNVPYQGEDISTQPTFAMVATCLPKAVAKGQIAGKRRCRIFAIHRPVMKFHMIKLWVVVDQAFTGQDQRQVKLKVS